MKFKFCRSIFVFSAFCLVSIFTSCVTVKSVGHLNKVYVTNTKQINILPPSYIQTEVDGQCYLVITFQDTSFGMLSYIQADKECLYINLMNDFGTEMGELYYDGDSVSLDCSLIPEALKGEYIVNDLQYALYDIEAVTKNLKASKLSFKVQRTESGCEERFVYNGDKLIEKVIINETGYEIINYLREYQYTIMFM